MSGLQEGMEGASEGARAGTPVLSSATFRAWRNPGMRPHWGVLCIRDKGVYRAPPCFLRRSCVDVLPWIFRVPVACA